MVWFLWSENMNHLMRLGLVSLVLITLLGSVAQPALANSKENSHYEFGDVWDAAVCANGQTIVEDFFVSVDVKTFKDNAGAVFMVEESVIQTGKIFLKDETNKVIYYENEHWKNMYKPNGTIMSPGIVMKVTIPGYGMVYKDIGLTRFVWDEGLQSLRISWQAGQHQFLDPDIYPTMNYTAACDFLTSLP
jgi:hypothetical protein